MNWSGGICNIFLLNRGRQPRRYHGNIFCWEKTDQRTLSHKFTPPLGKLLTMSMHFAIPPCRPGARGQPLREADDTCISDTIGQIYCIYYYGRTSLFRSATGHEKKVQDSGNFELTDFETARFDCTQCWNMSSTKYETVTNSHQHWFWGREVQ